MTEEKISEELEPCPKCRSRFVCVEVDVGAKRIVDTWCNNCKWELQK